MTNLQDQSKNNISELRHLKYNGQYREAIKVGQFSWSKVNSNKQKLEVACLMTHCCLLAGEQSAAEQWLKRATDIDEHHDEVQLNHARMLLFTGKAREAQTILEALSNITHEVEVLITLGACLRSLGDLGKSKIIFDDIILHNSENCDALINRGLINLSLGHKELGSNDLKRAYSLCPLREVIWPVIAGIFFQESKFKEASALYEQLVNKSPDNHTFLSNLAVCFLKLGKNTKALEILETALTIQPNCVSTLSNIGLAYEKIKEFERSSDFYRRSIQLAPNDPVGYYNLGIASQSAGDLETAIQQFKTAVSLKPDPLYALQLYTLAVQLREEGLLKVINQYLQNITTLEFQPKFQILRALLRYVEGDLISVKSALSKLNSMLLNDDESLADQIKFATPFQRYLNALLPLVSPLADQTENKIFHIGDSHVLTYAHARIHTSRHNDCSLYPFIIFGAKAFHFSQKSPNMFKAIAERIISNLPKEAKLWISFGEIDCRADEGIINVTKDKTPSERQQIIDDTVSGFVTYFAELCNENEHKLAFVNVPAPIKSTKYDENLNCEVNSIIDQFNMCLQIHTKRLGMELIDVYSHTKNTQGYSNHTYHIDSTHLSPAILNQVRAEII